MRQTEIRTETSIRAGIARLLARAAESRSLNVEDLFNRVERCLQKYLLKDDPLASEKDIVAFIEGLQADDLCLVVACERGDEMAWSDLVQRYSVLVKSAARGATSNEDTAEELAQSVWAELHGLKPSVDGRPAGKIAYYSGRGSLGGWLRAVVSQLAVDYHRKTSKMVQPEEEHDFDHLVRNASVEYNLGGSSTANPEIAVVEGRAATDVERALSEAIASLEAEERLLIKLYYFDGLRLHEAGTVLGVHEATASRRLNRAHLKLRKRVEELLVSHYGWTPVEVKASLAQIACELGLDIETMLKADNVDNQETIRNKK